MHIALRRPVRFGDEQAGLAAKRKTLRREHGAIAQCHRQGKQGGPFEPNLGLLAVRTRNNHLPTAPELDGRGLEQQCGFNLPSALRWPILGQL